MPRRFSPSHSPPPSPSWYSATACDVSEGGVLGVSIGFETGEGDLMGRHFPKQRKSELYFNQVLCNMLMVSGLWCLLKVLSMSYGNSPQQVMVTH